jgi:glycosyltransferase involved in cell wall biosynthesis
MNNKPTLSVVMPAYNEGGHIYKNLLETSHILSGFLKQYEIIAVNDGSQDETASEIARAAQKDSHIVNAGYEENRGKGHAISYGIERSAGAYIAFLDSDLELKPSMLHSYMKIMKESGCDIVIGSKQHPDSKINYPLTRKIMSYGYYVILKLLFRLNIHDTQTGIKLFKAEIIKPIMKNLTTDGYAFDIEILATAAHMGYSIKEAPVILDYSRSKKDGRRRIHLRDIIKIFKDTLKIKKAL